MGSQVNLKALGLNYSPNNLALPEGSLITANDVIIRRDNVVESRRGFREYSETFGDETTRSSQLLSYKDRILNHFYDPFGVGILSYDTGVLDANGKAIFADYAGDFQETEPGLRIKSIQSNKNLYFTTSQGIKKLAATSAATLGSAVVVNAGAVKAIDFTAELDLIQGQSTGFLGFDSAVAYRIIWGYKDVNENLILGSPSDSVSVYNYLSDVCSLDMNALCLMLDNIVQNNQNYYSAIHNISTNSASETFTDTFTNTYKTQLTDSADTLKTNLIGIATNIDRFSLLADINEISPSTYNKPLTISTFQILNKEFIITFLSNITSTFITQVAGSFNNPSQIAFDSSNNLFVCDSANNSIKKFDSSGALLATYAGFNGPRGITVDLIGNAYVADTLNHVIKKIDTGGVITTLAGTSGTSGSADGTGAAATFNQPSGLIVSGSDLYVCDTLNNTIRKIVISSAVVTTIAGTAGVSGDADGTGAAARFNAPLGIDVDSSSNFYIADYSNNKIRKMTSAFVVTTYAGPAAGSTASGSTDGLSTAAKFNGPTGIAVDLQGTLYITDNLNHTVRKIDTTQLVSTLAGTALTSGSTNSTGSSARFNFPYGVGIDSDGNIYVSELGNDDVRKLVAADPSNVFSIGDKIEIIAAETPFNIINNPNTNGDKYYTLTSISSNSIKFAFDNTDVAASTPSTNTQLFSYNYRDIINTDQNDITSVDNEDLPTSLVNLKTDYASNVVYSTIESNIYEIINRLKSELSGFISTNLQTIFVSQLNITSVANVKLTVNIPENVKNDIQVNGLDYFFQVYRTQNIIASNTQILGADITPDDEMNLVYEAFPTPQELIDLEVVFIDTYPDDLRGFNTPLYTNPATGEGISQSNEPPPIAKDINAFKNYVFYANTKTKHRLNPLNLLGTSNIQDGDKILITNGTTLGTTEYTFKLGSSEITSFTFDTVSPTPLTPATAANKHFTLFSANDIKEYFVWYRLDNKNISNVGIVGTTATFTTVNNHNLSNGDQIQISNASTGTGEPSVNGIYTVSNITLNTFDITIDASITSITVTNASFIPYFDDKTVLVVDILTGDSVQTIRDKTVNAINSLPYDFSCAQDSNFTYKFTVTNISEGITSDATNGNFATLLAVAIDQQGDGQDFANNQVLLSQVPSRAQAIDLTARSLIAVINKNLDSPVVAYYLSGANTLPGIINLESETLQDQEFYVMGSSTGVGSSFNPDISPVNEIKYRTYTFTVSSANATIGAIYKDSTNNQFIVTTTITGGTTLITEGSNNPLNISGILTKVSGVGDATITYSAYTFSSLINVINGTIGSNVFTLTSNSHGLTNGDKIIICNSNSNPIIAGIYAVDNCTTNTFDITSASNFINAGNQFSYSKLSDTVGSSNEEKPNRIYYSKLLRPEAVPVANALDVGSADKKILRIFPLRDSLFVFKEDGLFRISGETAPFVLSLFDSSCILLAPDSVSVANNIIYSWTNKGISNVTEAGVNEISRPIDTVILKLASNAYTNFSKLTWGVGYDSDNSYTVYTNLKVDDEYASIGFRFSNLTNTWTNFARSQTCGLINQLDDKIYTGSGVYNLIEQERKNFDRTDYSDRDFIITVLNNKILNNGQTILINDIDGIIPGDVVVQDQILTIHIFNSLLQKLDIDPVLQGGYETALTIVNGSNLLTAVQALATRLDTDPILTANYVTAITGLTDATDAFNVIINLLNQGLSGTSFKNYKEAIETKSFEVVVESINKTYNRLDFNLAAQFVVGEMRVYKAIPCEMQYAPVTFGDPLSLKQIYEATMMFNNKAFTKATASFSSDLKPEFFPIDFYGQGNGIFGHYSEPGFGFGFFGGGSNAAPFRTIIPRETQRCRFINVKFAHNIAREIWNLYGITLTGNASESTRAYR